MAEWRTTTLGKLCEEGGGAIQTGPFGSQLHASDYVAQGIPSVMPVNIGDNRILEHGIARISTEDARRLSRYLLAEGDIVYSRRGDVERRALVRREEAGWLCGTGCLRVRLGARAVADPLFVSYLLGTDDCRAWILRHAVGATMPNLNTSILGRVPLTVPSLPEQRAIAEVLGALDDKIAASVRIEDAEDALIQALYAASIRGRARPSPLLQTLNVQFGEPFSGGSFVAPGMGRPLIRIRDLKSFRVQVWTTETRPRETVVRPGDVLVGMDAEFVPAAWLGAEGVMNQRVCRVTSTLAGPAFVREALRQPLEEIQNYKSATTVIHLNKADLERHKVQVPDDAALESFEAQAEPLYAHRVGLALERTVLATTRDALLPALMSGKLRVRDAERLAEELT